MVPQTSPFGLLPAGIKESKMGVLCQFIRRKITMRHPQKRKAAETQKMMRSVGDG
ncbi:hypothetical protein ACFQ5H_06000 [Robinsoniella peoriensis]|uniref:hypothetical protein n=1 Tax=Robinsoniella sp. KNHs210 TaxID=1469950 RepID=UPI0012DF3F79|nr:hypothetical protein [Robinsoniella sp. KNHs210]